MTLNNDRVKELDDSQDYDVEKELEMSRTVFKILQFSEEFCVPRYWGHRHDRQVTII